MNKYEKLSDWLLGYTTIGNWLYFNVIRMEGGSSSVQSVPGNTIISEYIDGSKERELVFAISMIRLYDTEMSENNLAAIAEVESFENWIESQTTLPDFGTGYLVHEVEILEHVPNLSIEQDINVCNYLFQCRVKYLEIK